jgi:hypothetical protein
VRRQQRINKVSPTTSPNPKSLNTARNHLVTQGTRLHNLLLSRVGARTSSPRTSMIATGSTR